MSDEALVANVGIVDTDDNTHHVMPGVFRSFLCPHCSNTHFEVEVDGMKVVAAFHASDAEVLADMILHPTPAANDELDKATLKSRRAH